MVSGRRNETSVAAIQSDYEKVYITAIVITLGIAVFICIACIIVIGVCILCKRRYYCICMCTKNEVFH